VTDCYLVHFIPICAPTHYVVSYFDAHDAQYIFKAKRYNVFREFVFPEIVHYETENKAHTNVCSTHSQVRPLLKHIHSLIYF